MSLWRLPPILIVQMKRFKFDKISYQHRKLNQRIKFPSSSSSGDETIKSYLDMAPYMTNSKMENFEEIEPGLYKAKMNREEGEDEETLCTSYDLYAVIHHSGALGSGHYLSRKGYMKRNEKNAKGFPSRFGFSSLSTSTTATAVSSSEGNTTVSSDIDDLNSSVVSSTDGNNAAVEVAVRSRRRRRGTGSRDVDGNNNCVCM
eukprot:g4346.t1